jgi:hypothetical protein
VNRGIIGIRDFLQELGTVPVDLVAHVFVFAEFQQYCAVCPVLNHFVAHCLVLHIPVVFGVPVAPQDIDVGRPTFISARAVPTEKLIEEMQITN